MGINTRLLKADRLGIKTQEKYERLINELADQRLNKVMEYGEDRYSDDWSDDEHIWMIWSDVFRKFIRLRQLRKAMDLPGLREVLKDMANYCIMGMQIIDQINERKSDND